MVNISPVFKTIGSLIKNEPTSFLHNRLRNSSFTEYNIK